MAELAETPVYRWTINGVTTLLTTKSEALKKPKDDWLVVVTTSGSRWYMRWSTIDEIFIQRQD